MKEILFALILGFTFLPAPGGNVFAQNSRKVIDPNLSRNFIPYVHNLAELVNPDLAAAHMLNRNEVNIRAVRDFMKRFDQVDHTRWFSTPEGGYESYFMQNGYWDRVYYDKRGNWLCSLICYGETKLTRDIRSFVKSAYFDFDITMVEELRRPEGIEYAINLENSSEIRIVKVNREGELEVLQELDK